MDFDDMMQGQLTEQPQQFPVEEPVQEQIEEPIQQKVENQPQEQAVEEPQQQVLAEIPTEPVPEEAPKDEFDDLFGEQQVEQVTQAAVAAGAEVQVVEKVVEDSNEFNVVADPDKYDQLAVNFQRYLQQVDDEQGNAATGLKNVAGDYRTDTRAKTEKTSGETRKQQDGEWKEALTFIEDEGINSWKKISKMIDAENHHSRVYDVLTAKIRDEDAGDAVEELQSANLADF